MGNNESVGLDVNKPHLDDMVRKIQGNFGDIIFYHGAEKIHDPLKDLEKRKIIEENLPFFYNVSEMYKKNIKRHINDFLDIFLINTNPINISPIQFEGYGDYFYYLFDGNVEKFTVMDLWPEEFMSELFNKEPENYVYEFKSNNLDNLALVLNALNAYQQIERIEDSLEYNKKTALSHLSFNLDKFKHLDYTINGKRISSTLETNGVKGVLENNFYAFNVVEMDTTLTLEDDAFSDSDLRFRLKSKYIFDPYGTIASNNFDGIKRVDNVISMHYQGNKINRLGALPIEHKYKNGNGIIYMKREGFEGFMGDILLLSSIPEKVREENMYKVEWQ